MAATDESEAGKTASARPGKAGRIDYDKWHRTTKEMVDDVDAQDREEELAEAKALGLQDGKYARSSDHAEEIVKAKAVKQAKKVLDGFKKRDNMIKSELKGLLGPADADAEESKSADGPRTVRITRGMIDAGKRVISVSDTRGSSRSDTIVLTSDLSLLESKMKANAMSQVVKPKHYPDDAENDVVEEKAEAGPEKHRSVFGVIKGFVSNVHDCTILVKCKFISGVLELSHCTNVTVRIEKDAMVATIQADLCKDVTVEFRDAPSGKSPAVGKKMYWGEDKEDRIFHAGVSKMSVRLVRDGYLDMERLCDYEADGAKTVGNATKEEFQFITSVVDGEIETEAVVREGSTTGENARAMTRRELEESRKNRERAAEVAVGMAENMIKFKEKDGNGISKATKVAKEEPKEEQPGADDDDDEIEEVYGGMSKADIDAVVAECEKNKSRGNEAFKAGEYAQAVLLYSLALDKSSELPDHDDDDAEMGEKQRLFARDVVLSNRAACFLKLGQHEKAEEDGARAARINPLNVKGHFRHGLALHAQAKYQAAIAVLATAHKLEPKNRQIKEALQFAEVRFAKEMRKRMEG